jgi:hypothetical protein
MIPDELSPGNAYVNIRSPGNLPIEEQKEEQSTCDPLTGADEAKPGSSTACRKA